MIIRALRALFSRLVVWQHTADQIRARSPRCQKCEGPGGRPTDMGVAFPDGSRLASFVCRGCMPTAGRLFPRG